MAAPNWKVTFFFESFQSSDGIGGGAAVGWTETWFLPSSLNLNTAHDVLNGTDVSLYTYYRARCLPSIYSMQWIRASDTANPRNTKVIQPPKGRVVGQLKTNPPAQVTCCILADFTGVDTQSPPRSHHRRFLVRGLSTPMIDSNVIAAQNSDLNKVTQWLDFMAGTPAPANVAGVPYKSNWSIQLLQQGVGVAPIMTVQPYINDNHMIYVLGTGALPAPVRGNKYLIRSCKTPYFCNRVWTDSGITNVGGGLTLGRSRRVISGAFSGNASITPLALAYILPVQYVMIGLRLRHTGRPSHSLRGRRNPVT